MKLTENFSLLELTKSQTAERKGIDNTLVLPTRRTSNRSVRASYSQLETTLIVL